MQQSSKEPHNDVSDSAQQRTDSQKSNPIRLQIGLMRSVNALKPCLYRGECSPSPFATLPVFLLSVPEDVYALVYPFIVSNQPTLDVSVSKCFAQAPVGLYETRGLANVRSHQRGRTSLIRIVINVDTVAANAQRICSIITWRWWSCLNFSVSSFSQRRQFLYFESCVSTFKNTQDLKRLRDSVSTDTQNQMTRARGQKNVIRILLSEKSPSCTQDHVRDACSHKYFVVLSSLV